VSASALVLHYRYGRTRAAYGLLSALTAAAGLESLFGICVACRAFPLLMKAGLVSEESCERCANIWATDAAHAEESALHAS
jgi:hypothetical protein